MVQVAAHFQVDLNVVSPFTRRADSGGVALLTARSCRRTRSWRLPRKSSKITLTWRCFRRLVEPLSSNPVMLQTWGEILEYIEENIDDFLMGTNALDKVPNVFCAHV